MLARLSSGAVAVGIFIRLIFDRLRACCHQSCALAANTKNETCSSALRSATARKSLKPLAEVVSCPGPFSPEYQSSQTQERITLLR